MRGNEPSGRAGVAPGANNRFPIPMRGNETTHALKWNRLAYGAAFPIPMRGNESASARDTLEGLASFRSHEG